MIDMEIDMEGKQKNTNPTHLYNWSLWSWKEKNNGKRSNVHIWFVFLLLNYNSSSYILGTGPLSDI